MIRDCALRQSVALGNPRASKSAFTSGSRPRNRRYASARSIELPSERMCDRSRSFAARSHGPPAASNACQASAAMTSDHR